MSDNNDEYELPPAELELTQTRLRVEGGELVRRAAGGGTSMRVPLDDLAGVRFVREPNLFALAGVGMAAGIAAIGYYVSEYNVVTVILYVLALVGGVVSLFGVWNDVIEVKTRGETVRVACPDPTDEVAGFTASLKAMIGGRE